jgi:hypothetical protein
MPTQANSRLLTDCRPVHGRIMADGDWDSVASAPPLIAQGFVILDCTRNSVRMPLARRSDQHSASVSASGPACERKAFGVLSRRLEAASCNRQRQGGRQWLQHEGNFQQRPKAELADRFGGHAEIRGFLDLAPRPGLMLPLRSAAVTPCRTTEPSAANARRPPKQKSTRPPEATRRTRGPRRRCFQWANVMLGGFRSAGERGASRADGPPTGRCGGNERRAWSGAAS